MHEGRRCNFSFYHDINHFENESDDDPRIYIMDVELVARTGNPTTVRLQCGTSFPFDVKNKSHVNGVRLSRILSCYANGVIDTFL